MTLLLTLAILILTGVAFWQISKIFELSQMGRKKTIPRLQLRKIMILTES